MADPSSDEATKDLIKAAKRMQLNRMRRILSAASGHELKGGIEKSPERNVPIGLGLGVEKADDVPKTKKNSEISVVNGTDENGRSALHFSSGMSSSECTLLLLQAGANPNLKDKEGFTPLHLAAGYGRSPCVELLIKYGANPFVRDKLGHTPRELAEEIRNGNSNSCDSVNVSRGNMDAVISFLTNAEWKYHVLSKEKNSALAKQKKNSNDHSTGNVVYENIVNSASAGDYELVKSQLKSMDDKFFNPLKLSALGNALSAACRAGHPNIVELLLSNNAPVNNNDLDGATPILAAADSGHSECVRLLIKAGANTNAKDRVGVTAMIAAAYNGHEECLRALIENGAEVDAHSHGGVTPLIAAAEGRHANCIRTLLKAGADINAKTTEGKTPLMHALGRDGCEATLALIEGGCDLNAVDVDGLTALHHGAKNDSASSVKALCEMGGDVTKRCKKGRTPVMDAPDGSSARTILESHWSALESKIAQRQAELLKLLESKDDFSSQALNPTSKGKDKKRSKKRKNDTKKPADQLKSNSELLKADKNEDRLTDADIVPSLDDSDTQLYYHISDSEKHAPEVDNERCDSSICSSSALSTETSNDKQDGNDTGNGRMETEEEDDDSDWIKIETKKHLNLNASIHGRDNGSSTPALLSPYSLPNKSQGNSVSVDGLSRDVKSAISNKRKDSGNKQPKTQKKGVNNKKQSSEGMHQNQDSTWVNAVKKSSEASVKNKSSLSKSGDMMNVRQNLPDAVRHEEKTSFFSSEAENSNRHSKSIEMQLGLNELVGGERKEKMDRHLSGDVALLYCRVKGLEEEMEKKESELQREKFKVKELEKNLRLEMELKEEALKVREDLIEALDTQKEFSMEIEKEKKELESRVMEYQRMLRKSESREEDLTVSLAKLNLKLASLEEENREMRKRKQQDESMATAVVAMAASWQVMNLQNQLHSTKETSDSRRVEQIKALKSAYLNEYPTPEVSIPSMPPSSISSLLSSVPPETAASLPPPPSILSGSTSLSNSVHGSAASHLQAPNLDFDNPTNPSSFRSINSHAMMKYDPIVNHELNDRLRFGTQLAMTGLKDDLRNEGYPWNRHLKENRENFHDSYQKPPFLKSNHHNVHSFRKIDSVPDFRMFSDLESRTHVAENGLSKPNPTPISDIFSDLASFDESEDKFESLDGPSLNDSPLSRFSRMRSNNLGRSNTMTRSASEGCLHLMELHNGSAVLPFLKPTDALQQSESSNAGGWFSLVPSPLDNAYAATVKQV